MNTEVTALLDALQHPRRADIERLRSLILGAQPGLEENVKWNSPNYTFNGNDRITLRVQPPGKLQLIFHRGAQKQAQPASRLISDTSGLLEWKENDRAVATFASPADVERHSETLPGIVRAWLQAAG